MKKYMVFLLAVLLVGCSGAKTDTPLFATEEAVSFEIAGYEEKVDPVLGSVIPHIAYAKTQAQFEGVKARFDMEHVEMDMNESFAIFIVTYSTSCGIAVDQVYNKDGKLSAQLIEVEGQDCGDVNVPHTFVLKVDQGDYSQVQLFNGNIIKSSVDVE